MAPLLDAVIDIYSGGSRIPRKGRETNSGGGGLNLLFGIIFAENCMKKKKIRLRVRAGFPHTPRSTTD